MGVGAGAASELTFTVGSSTSASADAAVAALVPVTKNGHTLDLTQATLTVTRAELKRAQTDACRGDDDDANDDHGGSRGSTSGSASAGSCAEVKVGPVSIDLPLGGGVVTLPANAIPAGTYRELEVRVSFVRLKGTFDGQAFDLTLPVNAKSEIEFSTPLSVTDGTATSITVNVPVDTWLLNADGSLVDPSKISASPSLLASVKTRIAASLRAFEDRDHDGHDDHGGNRGRG